MKRIPCLTVLVGCLALPHTVLLAQPGTAPPGLLTARSAGQPPDYSVIERGPNHRVMARLTWTTNATGRAFAHTNSYTELQTGMSVPDPDTGQWRDSSPDFEITPDGYAVAAHCQHQVIVAPSLLAPEGVVDLLTPGRAVRLRSAVLGLSLFDPVSGKSLQIAGARECAGRQTAPNAITFFDAFDGLKADVRLRNEVGQFHQEVLLNEKLTPEQLERLGFDARTARLEVWTEFLAPPSPSVRTVLLQAETNAVLRATMAEPDTVDQFLGWGSMRMTRGKTFAEGQAGRSAVVFKQWLRSGGRSFLVEAATCASLQPLVDALPATRTAALKPKQSSTRLLADRAPPQRVQPRENRAVQIAKLGAAGTQPTGPQVVLDYVLLDSTQTNLTLQADTTYYIAGTVATDRLTVEGGTVVKYTNSPQATIVADEVVCRTASYRPATFTSKDLDSIGERINGSTGNPAGSYYGSIALDLTAATSAVVSNVNFSYLSNALAGTGILLRDAQIIDCYAGFAPPRSAPILRNVLIYRVGTLVAADWEMGGDDLTAENVTAHYCTNLMADGTSTVSLTNCVFACVGGWQGPFLTTNCTAILGDDSGIFQTIGAASHYLADNSPCRNAGTTNINPDLLAGLRHKTTYPPIVYSNVIISAETTLAPQAQRDTDAPDLGYHYDPLDYACKYLWLTNATLRLLPGTAIATFGPYGIALWSGSDLISEGTPTTLNHIARYNMVQECSTTNWSARGDSVLGNWMGGPDLAQISCRFTDWSAPAQDSLHFGTFQYRMVGSFTDCQFHSGRFTFWNYAPSATSVAVTNSLFERVHHSMDDSPGPLSPLFRNCLFVGGSLILYHEGAGAWTFQDNLFDQTGITQEEGSMDAAYNGYTPGSDHLMPTNANDVVASMAWETGPLGNYYQPTNSAFLTNGSIAANLVGLYHYTVLTNQAKETTNAVSRGYHYVAVDSQGAPLDTDQDGTPDYLEDANGNGQSDPGETPWSLAITSYPQSVTNQPGTTATFTVGATGAVLGYQWYRGPYPLAGQTNSSLVLTNVSATDAGTYCVTVSALSDSTNACATLTVLCLPSPSNLTGWWQGETNGYEAVGANNAALYDVTFDSGEVGGAFRFDGSGACGYVPACSNFNVGQGAGLTVECWIKPDDLYNGGPLVAWDDGWGDLRVALWVNWADGGALSADLYDADWNGGSISSAGGVLSEGSFQHVALTYNKATGLAVLYRNGSGLVTNFLDSITPLTTSDLYLGGDPAWSVWYSGLLDEVGLYDRALDTTEIRAIYDAGSLGRCGIPPGFVLQPDSLTAIEGNRAVLRSLATGTSLNYQWRTNGSPISGATEPCYALPGVEAGDAGTYSVQVTNALGTITSTDAVLTVNPAICCQAPTGLVSWWQAEGDALDSAGTNHGVLLNGAWFAAGRAGGGLSMNGTNQCVEIPWSPSLVPSNYTIEAWVEPMGDVDSQVLLFGQPYGHCQLVGRSGSAWGRLALYFGISHYTFYGVDSQSEIPLGEWSHLAGTWDGTMLRLYINGVLNATNAPGHSPVDSGCPFYIGGFHATNGNCAYVGQFFNGILDEVSYYSRALSADEIASIYNASLAGKCRVPPTILVQPASQTVGVGATVQFSVVASGTVPLTYQWYLGGQPLSDGGGISGSRAATLVLANVQKSQAGSYYVVVRTCGSSATSATATLSVGGPSGMWVYTGSLNSGREFHTAALLSNGQVLVAGGDNAGTCLSSTELYDPTNGIWTVTNAMTTPRAGSIATRLLNGQVLVAGGTNATGVLSSAELYNPASGAWMPTDSMDSPRLWFTATLLTNGQVLVAGGTNASGVLSSAELYDPATGTWTGTGSLHTGRKAHTATRLGDGQVLVAGGDYAGGYALVGELYNPATGTWTEIGSLHSGHGFHTATLLADGKVLVAGGANASGILSSAELYHTNSQTWTVAGSLNYPRERHEATLLSSGQVLVAGGDDGPSNPYASAELYDPVTGTWRMTGPMNQARSSTIMTLLTNGQVLVAGGSGPVSSAEIYRPSSSPAPVIRLQPQSQAVCSGSSVTFHVAAAGAAPLSYQWMKDGVKVTDGGHISGAKTATLTLSGTSTADAASYTVTVGGGGGAVNSTPAALTFIGPPTIDTQPFSQTNFSGASVPFSVGAGGSGWASYQWYFNGSALSDGAGVSGSHASTLMLRNVQQSQAGSYYVVLSHCGGSTTSSTATLTIGDSIPGPWPWPWPWPWPGPFTWTYSASPMGAARVQHTATLLSNGKVLAAGGSTGDATISTAELYDPDAGTWTFTGSMNHLRRVHSATLLGDGRVLVAGGLDNVGFTSRAELYNPSGGTWSDTGSLNCPRGCHVATLLGDGKVLVAGGAYGFWYPTASAELYDPSTGTWTTLTNSLSSPRYWFTATLLSNGQVLAAGGYDGQEALPSADLYDPTTRTWTATGSLHSARANHVAMRLPSGQVLVAGGWDGVAVLSSAELYDPNTQVWTVAGSMDCARHGPAATLLPSGKVLVAGGSNGGGQPLPSAELYDPLGGTWSMTTSMNQGRIGSTLTMLNNGKALFSGGWSHDSTSELYLPDLTSPRPPAGPFTIWITEPKANANLP